MKKTSLCALAMIVAFPLAADQHNTVDWQQAVAELAAEKTRAETCVSLAKQHLASSGAALAEVQLDYGEAKAEMDAIIGGLVVVLNTEGEPEAFSSFEERLTRAVRLREELCDEVIARLPQDEDEGSKSLVGDILGKALAALIGAAKDIYIFHKETDEVKRNTIQVQVEATRWRAYEDIPA